MTKKIIYSFLLIILIADLSYSFLQYYHTNLDGDMAGGIVPSPGVQKIFNDPTGLKAIINSEKHPNPNRYFAHLFFREYFSKAPVLMQKFTNPIDSVYYSCAIIKLIIHIGLIYLLSTLIVQSSSLRNIKLIMIAILLSSLFQAYGYNRYMGVIDRSTTYTFFYALPLMLLMLFYWILYQGYAKSETKKWGVVSKLILALLVIILPFSGPLIPPVILIVTLLLIFRYISQNSHSLNKSIFRKITKTLHEVPKTILIYSSILLILCIYSMFLGKYNSINSMNPLPVIERYLRLPMGIYNQFTQKLGFPILLIMIGLNIVLIRKKFYKHGGQNILGEFKWISIFILLYILLLPLGGYKPYRHYILRYDTIMPVTLCLFYILSRSSWFLIEKVRKWKWAYYSLIIIFAANFTNSDISQLNECECEKQSLHVISKSEQTIVPLDSDCTVISWQPVTDYSETKLQSELLKIWGITSENKYYYHNTAN